MPCLVEFVRPTYPAYRDWRLATTMTVEQAEFFEFGTYRAENYDELIDHPVEMGVFSHTEFEVAGVAHHVVISGRHSADMSRLSCDLKAICQQHVQFFGELPKMQRYLFQVLAVNEGYGGLEHRSSTSLICKRTDLPQQTEKKVTEGYRQFLGLCSHEYFHLWNVKRTRPEVLKGSTAFDDTGRGRELIYPHLIRSGKKNRLLTSRRMWYESLAFERSAILSCGPNSSLLHRLPLRWI